MNQITNLKVFYKLKSKQYEGRDLWQVETIEFNSPEEYCTWVYANRENIELIDVHTKRSRKRKSA